jgi:hypothetical protein
MAKPASGTRVTLIAGTHGDEGPGRLWRSRALPRPVAQLTGRLRHLYGHALAAEVERRTRIDSQTHRPDSVFLEERSFAQRPSAAARPLSPTAMW